MRWFSLAMSVFAGYNLFEWCTTGQLYYSSRLHPGTYITYGARPNAFIFAAVIHIGCFFLFGYGTYVSFFAKRRS